MSKLPYAPLVDVVFELRWKLESKEELDKHQYLHGDIYALVKEKYPYRENLYPSEVPLDVLAHTPTHRFRKEKGGYPLVQTGVGLLTVNTNDKDYFWETYKDECIATTKKLFDTFDVVRNKESIVTVLQYQDFLLFDFEKENVYDYLKNNLHIEIKQNFFQTKNNPYALNLSFQYPTECGNLEIHLQRASNQNKENGILVKTIMLNSLPVSSDKLHIEEWLEEAHKITSRVFKEMTKGELQANFSKK